MKVWLPVVIAVKVCGNPRLQYATAAREAKKAKDKVATEA